MLCWFGSPLYHFLLSFVSSLLFHNSVGGCYRFKNVNHVLNFHSGVVEHFRSACVSQGLHSKFNFHSVLNRGPRAIHEMDKQLQSRGVGGGG